MTVAEIELLDLLGEMMSTLNSFTCINAYFESLVQLHGPLCHRRSYLISLLEDDANICSELNDSITIRHIFNLLLSILSY